MINAEIAGSGDADEEGKDDGSDSGGPDGVGQDVGLGGFRSQGPRLFHQPPTTPPPPAPAVVWQNILEVHQAQGAGAISLQEEEAQGPGLSAWLPSPPLASPSPHIGMHVSDQKV